MVADFSSSLLWKNVMITIDMIGRVIDHVTRRTRMMIHHRIGPDMIVVHQMIGRPIYMIHMVHHMIWNQIWDVVCNHVVGTIHVVSSVMVVDDVIGTVMVHVIVVMVLDNRGWLRRWRCCSSVIVVC